MEGTLTGTFNELTMQNGIPLTPEQQLALIEQYGGLDVWGSELVAPHYAAAWAWAGNSPFQWGKQVASHLGGTRQGMVIRWPRRITDAGGLRSQFTHCIDIGPTILELAGLPQPTHVDGIAQTPMHGTSFLHTFADAGRPGAAHPAVLRDLRQPGHVQGRLVARQRCCRASRGTLTPADDAEFAPGVWHPDDDPASCTTCPMTSPRRTTWPPAPREGQGTAGAVLGRGREVHGPPAAGWPERLLRHRPAAARPDHLHLLR